MTAVGQPAGAAPEVATVAVRVSEPGAAIPPTLFGLFFEDINFAADGGLYPELVKNRSFEFAEPLAAWWKIAAIGGEGELLVRADGGPSRANPHYLRLRSYGSGAAGLAIMNGGFRGMGIQAGATYTFSAWARRVGSGPREIRATLTDEKGAVIGEAKLSGFSAEWKRHEAALQAKATSPRARLNLYLEAPGELDVDMVSLYPRATWKDRPGGLRKDLVQLLADMKPGFLRFPGGCIVEGRRLAQRYQWKKTVGDPMERPTIINRWNDELAGRFAPDYFQSFGLGFFEYFQLAEDIGAAPLPILNCGMACQFNSSETAAVDQLGEYIEDALDLIEFANGRADSRWGSVRARMGHPAPFGLAMIGVGNEQWGPRYLERYRPFAAAIKAKHPEIALVGSAGPGPAGKQFDFLWSNMRALKADIVDEHFYEPPTWFLANAGRYDRYDRGGPKVFVGEYAAQTAGVVRPDNRNNWEAALAEAAFMTGLERNADVVVMASYAPLFAHVDAWQWTPNLIWFDNLRAFGTPSYHVQKLFASNRGTRILPVSITGGGDGLYASASIDERSGEVIVKAVNATARARPVRLALQGARLASGSARAIVVAADPKAENDLDHPTRVAPVESSIQAGSSPFDVTLQPSSVTVLRLRRDR